MKRWWSWWCYTNCNLKFTGKYKNNIQWCWCSLSWNKAIILEVGVCVDYIQHLNMGAGTHKSGAIMSFYLLQVIKGVWKSWLQYSMMFIVMGLLCLQSIKPLKKTPLNGCLGLTSFHCKYLWFYRIICKILIHLKQMHHLDLVIKLGEDSSELNIFLWNVGIIICNFYFFF